MYWLPLPIDTDFGQGEEQQDRIGRLLVMLEKITMPLLVRYFSISGFTLRLETEML
jgi:hypothetical protein